jgi:hypothetical protein
VKYETTGYTGTGQPCGAMRWKELGCQLAINHEGRHSAVVIIYGDTEWTVYWEIEE